MNALLRLYPTAWRTRYGDELEDIVTHRALGLAGSLDLVRGALDAHRHPELADPAAYDAAARVTPQRLADLRIARRLGIGAWIGGLLWLTGWVIAANGPMVVDGHGSYRDGAAGWPFVFAAMVLLSAGLLGQLIRLPANATVVRLGAFAAMVSGPVWGLGPWVLPIGALTLAALLIVGVGAWWREDWSGWSAGALVASGLTGLSVAVVALTGLFELSPGFGDPAIIAVAAFAPIWLVVGATLRTLPEVTHPDLRQPLPRGLAAT